MPQKLHEQAGYFYKYTHSDRSIDLCILTDTYHKSFCIFGDFCASGTQDAEVTKSLFYDKQLKIIVKGGGGVARASSQLGKSDIYHKKP